MHPPTCHPWARLGLLALLLAASLGFAAAAPPRTSAAGEVDFFNNELEVDLPYGLTFTITAKSGEKVASLALEYGTNARSCVRSVARQPVEIEAGTAVDAEWEWDFVESGSLPMGAEVWWEWEATLANGETVRSLRQTRTLLDQRYTWEQTGSNPQDPTSVNLWHHDTSAGFARDLAQTAQEALQRLQGDFGAAPSRPVQIILYNSLEEVFESGLYFTEWVGGYASLDYGLVVIGVEQGDYGWGEEVITHELGHLVSSELTANCLGVSIPTWLSEGFSMHSEGGADRRSQDLVKQALADGTLPPLRTLAAGFAAGDVAAALSYAQSAMVFDFLFDEYGAEKMMALFATIQTGTLTEDALRQVYGLDVDGVDNAWRLSLGFAASAALPTATPTPLPSAVPTLPLVAPYAASPTPSHTPPPPTATLAPPATATQAVEPAPTEAPVEEKGGGLPCAGSSAMLLGAALAGLAPLALRKGRLP